MRRGLAGDTATPILPISVFGMPALCVSSTQLSPPSVDFQSPLRPLPDCIPQGERWNFHIAAKRIRGLVGSSEMSVAPVESLRNSTFFHDVPPSVVRNTPRSAFGPKACPIAATYARSGSRGSIRMVVICCVPARPR